MRIGQACDIGDDVALLEGPERLGALREVVEHPCLVPLRLGLRAHLQCRLGDHAEQPLRADQELAQPGARGGGGNRAQGELSRRRDALSPLTSLSIAPYPVEAWPAERVATQPPTVAYSHDWG